MGNIVSGLIGAAILAVIIVAGAIVYAWGGFYGVAADTPRGGAIEKAVAYVRERSIDARTGGVKVALPKDPNRIASGAAHYNEMCTGCHLAPGMKDNEMRPGLNPRPPRLAAFPAAPPAEQFWIVRHGIKMTAMPAWGLTHSDEELWNIVAFLQKLPKLSPHQYSLWVKLGGGHREHQMGEHGGMKPEH